MKLILFDIDGTILNTDGAGRRSMEAALTTVFGVPGAPTYRYDGKTDRQIAREQMRAAGFSDADVDERFDALVNTYLENLGAELERSSEAAVLLGGVTELLDAVERADDTVLGLLTGNVDRGAARKLAAVGVDFVRFRVNAFGSDHEHRHELPAVAQRRARELLGLDVPGDRVVIIGDTPSDISCGRAIGARAVAVATGRYAVPDLAEHQPYAVFDDLRDTDRVLQAILS